MYYMYVYTICTIENQRKFSKRMLKCNQKGDKKDLHKNFLHCFEVLNTLSED